jgi:hypothetical protein
MRTRGIITGDRLTGWIGHVCTRTTLRGRQRRRERCDLLNHLRVV